MDVRRLIRTGSDADLEANIQAKWMGRQINTTRFVAPPRPMYSIGG